MLENIGTEDMCPDGVTYTNATNYRGWPTNDLPNYFDYESVCCQPNSWLAQWIRDIGEVVGRREMFQVYAEQIEFYHDN